MACSTDGEGFEQACQVCLTMLHGRCMSAAQQHRSLLFALAPPLCAQALPVFTENGHSSVPAFYGDLMLVNGKVWPRMTADPRRYRLRLLNACNCLPIKSVLSSVILEVRFRR